MNSPPNGRACAPPLRAAVLEARGPSAMAEETQHLAPGTAERENGGNRIRTGDPLLAKQVLYQLSYAPSRQQTRRRNRAYRGSAAICRRWRQPAFAPSGGFSPDRQRR
jgi:hypothetical protein